MDWFLKILNDRITSDFTTSFICDIPHHRTKTKGFLCTSVVLHRAFAYDIIRYEFSAFVEIDEVILQSISMSNDLQSCAYYLERFAILCSHLLSTLSICL